MRKRRRRCSGSGSSLRIHFVNFPERTDWHRRPASTVLDGQGRTSPLVAMEPSASRIAVFPNKVTRCDGGRFAVSVGVSVRD